MTKYRATVTREDGYWLGEVPGLPGAHAYARTLSKLRHELADAVILAADLADDARVTLLFDVTEAVDPKIADAFAVAAERVELAAREVQLASKAARVAEQLTRAGWSVRDVAGALDLSPGRVSQITNPTDKHEDKDKGRPVPATAEVQRMRGRIAAGKAAKSSARKSTASRTKTATTGRSRSVANPSTSRREKH